MSMSTVGEDMESRADLAHTDLGKMAAAGTIGAPCNGDGDCTQTNASCILPGTRNTWTGGYCTIRDCTTVGCPTGTFCQVGMDGLGTATCFYDCTSDFDCRADYKCCAATSPAGTGTKVCVAAGVFC
jgi:hypothetical protein